MGKIDPVPQNREVQRVIQTLQGLMARSDRFLAEVRREYGRRGPKPDERAAIAIPDVAVPFNVRLSRTAEAHAESFGHARPTEAEWHDELEMLELMRRMASQILQLLKLLPPDMVRAWEESGVFRPDWRVSDEELGAAFLTCVVLQHYNAASSGERRRAVLGAHQLPYPGTSLTTLVDLAGVPLFDYTGPQRQVTRAS